MTICLCKHVINFLLKNSVRQLYENNFLKCIKKKKLNILLGNVVLSRQLLESLNFQYDFKQSSEKK